MTDAINKRRAQNLREQQRNKDKHGFIDLNDTPQEEQQQPGNNNKTLKATVSKNCNQPMFATVSEDKGGGTVPDYTSDDYQDEYSKYDPEPNTDQFLINSGATIIVQG